MEEVESGSSHEPAEQINPFLAPTGSPHAPFSTNEIDQSTNQTDMGDDDDQSEELSSDTQFAAYFNNKELSDVILRVEDTTFHAHKMVLAMTSDFFKTLFYSDHWSLSSTYVHPQVIQHDSKSSLKKRLRSSSGCPKPSPPSFQSAVTEKFYSGKRTYKQMQSQDVTRVSDAQLQDPPAKRQKPSPQLTVRLIKLDEVQITDTTAELFSQYLQLSYNQNLSSLSSYSADKLIKLHSVADRFIFTRLAKRILRLLRKKFTTIHALRIFLWMRRYYDDDAILPSMDEFIVTKFNFVFYTGVFEQADLDLAANCDTVVGLIQRGSHSVQAQCGFLTAREKSRSDELVKRVFDRALELAQKVCLSRSGSGSGFESESRLIVAKCLQGHDLGGLTGRRLDRLLQLGVLSAEEMSKAMQAYLGRKQALKALWEKKCLRETTNGQERQPGCVWNDSTRYSEVSGKIKKVTFNTDSFDQQSFEMRSGKSFHFNSGRVGKFIECEFENAIKICRSKILGDADVSMTFVIQASRDQQEWFIKSCFRHTGGMAEVKWPTKQAYRFWRVVLVDHSGRDAWFQGISWYTKARLKPPGTNQREQSSEDSDDLVFVIQEQSRQQPQPTSVDENTQPPSIVEQGTSAPDQEANDQS